jgi:hypothetical protein
LNWQYLHEYVDCRIDAKKVVWDAGDAAWFSADGERMVTTEWRGDMVADALSNRGAEGWEVCHMEARWSWRVKEVWGPGATAGYAYPNHLVGYYVTFRRPATP